MDEYIYRERKSEKRFKMKEKNDGECEVIEESKEKENGFEISSPFSRFLLVLCIFSL